MFIVLYHTLCQYCTLTMISPYVQPGLSLSDSRLCQDLPVHPPLFLKLSRVALSTKLGVGQVTCGGRSMAEISTINFMGT